MLHWIDDFDRIPPSCQGGIVSIGNFDGVHRGHLRLVECMRWLGRIENAPTVAFTFDPHPAVLLQRQAPGLMPLTWTERKAALLQEHGVDEVIVVRTSLALLGLSSEEFFHRVIRGGLRARGLVEGPNFAFGRDRGGSIATLNRLCPEHGLVLEVVDPLFLDGQIVSSSRIRQCLEAGDVVGAARLLGRPHRLRGRVVPGAGRGGQIGFPTANLDGLQSMAPADGVYAARAEVAGRSWPAAVNVGPNVTFAEEERKVEAHVIGFTGPAQGEALELELLARLRDVRTFPDAAGLAEQIRRDVESVRAIVASAQEAAPQPGRE